MSSNLSLSTGSFGKIGTAPCGHRGEAIVGQYYACLEGCDAKGGTPPVAMKPRLAGLPAHISRGGCSCVVCRVGVSMIHTTCKCTWCAYARHVTTLRLLSNGLLYTQLLWDGTGDAVWKVDARTAQPYVIDRIEALTDKGTLKVEHTFGSLLGGGPQKSPPLATSDPRFATSATLRLIVEANKITLTFAPPPVTIAATVPGSGPLAGILNGNPVPTAAPTPSGRQWVIAQPSSKGYWSPTGWVPTP